MYKGSKPQSPPHQLTHFFFARHVPPRRANQAANYPANCRRRRNRHRTSCSTLVPSKNDERETPTKPLRPRRTTEPDLYSSSLWPTSTSTTNLPVVDLHIFSFRWRASPHHLSSEELFFWFSRLRQVPPSGPHPPTTHRCARHLATRIAYSYETSPNGVYGSTRYSSSVSLRSRYGAASPCTHVDH